MAYVMEDTEDTNALKSHVNYMESFRFWREDACFMIMDTAKNWAYLIATEKIKVVNITGNILNMKFPDYSSNNFFF